VAYFAVLALRSSSLCRTELSVAAAEQERAEPTSYFQSLVTAAADRYTQTAHLHDPDVHLFSAPRSFMAFTYLLKGIDMPSILFVLLLALLGSIGFSMFGLFLPPLLRGAAGRYYCPVVMNHRFGICHDWIRLSCRGDRANARRRIPRPRVWLVMGGLLTAYVTFLCPTLPTEYRPIDL